MIACKEGQYNIKLRLALRNGRLSQTPLLLHLTSRSVEYFSNLGKETCEPRFLGALTVVHTLLLIPLTKHQWMCASHQTYHSAPRFGRFSSAVNSMLRSRSCVPAVSKLLRCKFECAAIINSCLHSSRERSNTDKGQ